MTDPRHDLPRPGPTDGTHLRQIKSYVLRAGRMGPGQERALEALGPRFVLPYDPTLRFNPAAAFGRDAPLILEIGFRHGRRHRPHRQLRARRQLPVLRGAQPGVGALLKRIGESSWATSASWQHDAVEVLRPHAGTEATLDGVHIFFPDPWHKKKHHKRRLIQPPLVPGWPRASNPAATCTAPPTGSPTPSRCWPCWAPSRCWRTQPMRHWEAMPPSPLTDR
jgi:tRNA (guanine-N7-)-methyltransferase